MKELEKQGFKETVKYVLNRIFSMNEKNHWRIILDLSDFAKREGLFEDAIIFFKITTRI